MYDIPSEFYRLKAIVELSRDRPEVAYKQAEQALFAARGRLEGGRTQRLLGEILSQMGRTEEAEATYADVFVLFESNPYEQELTRRSYQAHLG